MPASIDAVPNTYAALLNGPPMSMDIIPPIINPSKILFVPDKEFNASASNWFNQEKNGLIANIITLINKRPATG